jgi:uncharacterized protein DUF4349
VRIVPFPGNAEPVPEESWLTELEAALNGDAHGPAADSWRELRDDVRASAPPIAPAFERQLRQRLAQPSERDRPAAISPPDVIQTGTASSPPASTASSEPVSSTPAGQVRTRSASRRLLRGWTRLRPRGRIGAAAAATATTAIAVAVLLIAAGQVGTPKQPQTPKQAQSHLAGPGARGNQLGPSAGRASGSSEAASAVAAPIATKAVAVPLAAASGPAAAPGRVQQLAASLSLTAAPDSVQETADRVARLAVRDGGFVQNSHVQVQQTGTSEANLVLKLPSAKLSAALASLGALAPVRSETQSLQDITDAYDAARRRLSDASAERQALLRALARATSEGQIDSLRQRISLASGAVAQASSALAAVSQRASTAAVEVTVIGDAAAASEGLTLHRGLHDAGRVLIVTLVVLLVAAAVLVPLALVLGAVGSGRGVWRRYQRERALDAR